MVDYFSMPFGYSLDLNLTDLCNINCRHCYMPKKPVSLTFEEVQQIFSRIPKSLDTLVLSGGEPFMNYKVLYQTIECARSIFPLAKIRITSNAKSIYSSDEEIIHELNKLEKAGVNEIRLSCDQYHIDAGINVERLFAVGKIADSISSNIKVSYLDVGKGRPIGEFKERKEGMISKASCLNRPKNIFKPYLFMETSGELYVCAFRLTKSLGNLIHDEWTFIANNIEKQYDYLSGNVLSIVVKNTKDSALNYELYNKFGECHLCEQYQKICKNS